MNKFKRRKKDQTKRCKQCIHWKNAENYLKKIYKDLELPEGYTKRCAQGYIVKENTRACFKFWLLKSDHPQFKRKFKRKDNL